MYHKGKQHNNFGCSVWETWWKQIQYVQQCFFFFFFFFWFVCFVLFFVCENKGKTSMSHGKMSTSTIKIYNCRTLLNNVVVAEICYKVKSNWIHFYQSFRNLIVTKFCQISQRLCKAAQSFRKGHSTLSYLWVISTDFVHIIIVDSEQPKIFPPVTWAF